MLVTSGNRAPLEHSLGVIEFLEKIVLKPAMFWYTEVVFYSPREIISTTNTVRIFHEGESKFQTFLKL